MTGIDVASKDNQSSYLEIQLNNERDKYNLS